MTNDLYIYSSNRAERVAALMSNIVAYEADTDGFVVLGSRVIVYTMSGRVVLALTTEQDNSISELTDYCFRKCAANEAMPQVCVRLEWKPPVPIRSRVGLNLRQRPVLMEATLVSIPIQSDKYMYYMPSDRCLVCYDAATDIDELRIKRSVNCVRCEPCTLCDNCKVKLAGVNVCLQCITPDEVKLLDEGSRKRLNLIDCEQSVKDALHL